MKFFLLAFAVFAAGVSADIKLRADETSSRFIDGIIVDAINNVRQQIVDAGLDPLQREVVEAQYSFPVTDLLFAEALVQNVLVEGISNIVVNDINFSLLTTRLRFTISLPRIAVSLNSANAKVALGNWEADASASGSVVIDTIRVVGDVRVSILGGVSIRSMDIDFSINGIESNVNVEVLGRDLSDQVNDILGNEIPNFLSEFSNDINRVIEFYLTQIIESLL